MSAESANAQQQKVREFMGLMPLTLAVAGLPDADPGRYFTDGQMEARATALKSAYKMARQIIMDVSK
jgi:hypothetical protein